MLSVANEPVMLSVIMLSVIMLSVIMLSVIILRVIMLSVIMLSVIMLSVIMLSVIMLSVIMLSVIMLSVIRPLLTFMNPAKVSDLGASVASLTSGFTLGTMNRRAMATAWCQGHKNSFPSPPTLEQNKLARLCRIKDVLTQRDLVSKSFIYI
jgi:hypothetical protein